MSKYLMDENGHLTRNPNYNMRDRFLEQDYDFVCKELEKLRNNVINQSRQIENLKKENAQLKAEKNKWFNAFHNQIMKPF